MASPAERNFARLATGAVAALVLGSASTAATPSPWEDAFRLEAQKARGLRFGGRGANFGFNADDAFGRWWSVVTVYMIVDGPHVKGQPVPRHWVARQVRGGKDKPVEESWASTLDCPALLDVLAKASILPTDAIRVPFDAVLPSQRKYVADGAGYTVWSDEGFQPDGSSLEVSISSRSGALADWGDSAFKTLEPCWKAERPSI